MKRKMKNCLLCLTAGLLLLASPATTASAEGTANYCIGNGGMNRVAPVAYEVDRVYHAVDLDGVDNLNDLSSMFTTADAIYVSTADAVLVLDYDFQVKHILSEYKDEKGAAASISKPAGLFVTKEGLLYVCEPDQGQILVFDQDFQLVKRHGKPSELNLSVTYMPTQVVVDSLDRMYIIAQNIFEGILEVSSENRFQRFFGTTTIQVSPLDLFFRAIASEKQRSKQQLLLPTAYTSMTVNEKGFIYTTIQATDEDNPVRLLNVNGSDIMPENWQGDPPQGDINFPRTGEGSGPAKLTYIDTNRYGMYMVLDKTRNRIFTYDDASNILFVFGGSGDKDGCFRNPVSMRWMGDSGKVLVADRLACSLTLMRPTKYAGAILEAVRLESEGRRDEALSHWREVLAMNSNCDVAKDAIGRSLYWSGDYTGSQEMLQYIGRTDYYSMAFEKTREALIRRYAPATVLLLAALIAAAKVLRFVRGRKGGSGYAKG